MDEKTKTLAISSSVGLALIIIGFISHNPGIIGNLVIAATFIIVTPYLIFYYKSYRRIKEMEEKFPIFLRDLTEALHSGMDLPKAIKSVSKLNYGELSKEVKKMSNQLSWGVPADKVLDMLAERLKESKRMYTSLKVIREAYLSGGDVASILESVADASEMLEEMEKDRRSEMGQYVVLMYAISLILLAIVIAIVKFLLPIFNGPMNSGGIFNPCGFASGFSVHVCDLYAYTAKYIFNIQPYSVQAYYVSLFFYMSIIQAIFSGLIAGQISEGSYKAGIKHVVILVGIIFGLFTVAIRLGLLSI